MSGNGVFMRLPSQLRPNTRIILTVNLPTEITKVPLKLRCLARVVSQRDGVTFPFGIGAVIDDYQIRTVRNHA
jgi:penicillin V acylase-like amidase (Ntn superfamily)